jgi:hypothetical protein
MSLLCTTLKCFGGNFYFICKLFPSLIAVMRTAFLGLMAWEMSTARKLTQYCWYQMQIKIHHEVGLSIDFFDVFSL